VLHTHMLDNESAKDRPKAYGTLVR
jgi:hypothetical protein